MRFSSIPAHSVLSAIKPIVGHNTSYASITLNNGSSIFGQVVAGKSRLAHIKSKGYLEVLSLQAGKPQTQHVAIRNIAGVSPIPYLHNVLGDKVCMTNPLEKIAFAKTKSGFGVAGAPGAKAYKTFHADIYSVDLGNSPNWEYKRNPKGTAVYSDWDYFYEKSGGISGIGISIVGGGSVSWKKSLYSEFWQALRGPTKDISYAYESETTLVKGYPLEANVTAKGKALRARMEGSEWKGYLICAEKPSKEKPLKNIGWILAYFKKKSFLIPKELLRTISDPIHFYGDIVTAKATSKIGTLKGYLKVRAAGVTQ